MAPFPLSLCEGGPSPSRRMHKHPRHAVRLPANTPSPPPTMTPLPPYQKRTPLPMSQHHARIKNDPRWKAARAEVLERDGYTCVLCPSTEDLQVDHVIDLALIIDTEPDLAFDPANLRTLCQPCHAAKEHAEALVRHPWVHPDYPELSDLVDGAILKASS